MPCTFHILFGLIPDLTVHFYFLPRPDMAVSLSLLRLQQLFCLQASLILEMCYVATSISRDIPIKLLVVRKPSKCEITI